ncbi:nitroreductase/quinone reductase family protein [Dactylosporangium sp. AC04546]|uniref:nitroreductase/quinone reductase family protein n=1 Tax=unclassified Dactylosporangium TaxID=2621675 RepID=UPI001EDE852C|nr:nitroreductase/quinone reductase family protein [Dactylosporangium sp. AC04546]WVK86464.1 nitroreductase/quinone reductase family protein [Dactylosporangium sp. AC04546]
MGAELDELADRVDRLEQMVSRLTDTLDIIRLLASYGPSVDSDSHDLAGEIWVEDGVYDVDGWEMEGRGEIREMLAGEHHQPYIATGSAHQVSMPVVDVHGDTATALGFMSLIQRTSDGFTIRRQTANRWDLVRTDKGWRVKRRTNRLLNGSVEARDLLRATLLGSSTISGALTGHHEPGGRGYANEQVELFERSEGAEGNTMHGLPVVVLTTRGRTSGKLRKNPLMRVEHEGQYVVVASMGGAPTHPTWFENLQAHPVVELQDGPTRRAYRSHVLTGDERATWWDRAVAAFPQYAEYQERTTREIPVVLLDPA